MSRQPSVGFLLCPECQCASSGQRRDEKRYRCPVCGHKWDFPHHELSAAYIGTLNDIEIWLHTRDGRKCRIKELPAVIGRRTTSVLYEAASVSREHCRLEYNEAEGCFYIRSLTDNATHVGGRALRKDETCPLPPENEFTLANLVELRLEFRFRCERTQAVPGEGNTGKDVQLPGEGIVFLCEGEQGILYPQTEFREGCLAAVNAFAKRIYAFERDAILLRNKAFIDHALEDGDRFRVRGRKYIYDAGRNAFRFDKEKDTKGVELTVRDLRVAYGKHLVLNHVSCSVPRGKVTALVGRSGCGKSTLMSVLSGGRKQSAGKIEVDGAAKEEYDRWATEHVSLVPQFDIVHRELTVGQCVGYAVEMQAGQGMNASLREARVNGVLRATGMLSFKDHVIDQLSGGQIKRVSIASEIVDIPDLLLLDEPTTGLDYATEEEILEMIRDMSARGLTILYVTHSLQAIKAADHVILLENEDSGGGSEVAAEGTPDEVCEKKGYDSWEALYRDLTAVKEHEAIARSAGTLRISKLPVLFSRYVTIWVNSPVLSALSFLGIPLILGLAVSVATGTDADRALLGLVAMLWMGMNQSVREIVKEKNIFLHEHRGVPYSVAFLSSKVLFFISVAVAQAFLMSVPILYLDFTGYGVNGLLHISVFSFADIFLRFIMAGATGCILGLFVSAVCMFFKRKGEILAVLLSVLLTLPQILFSDKVIKGGLFDDSSSTFSHYYNFITVHTNDKLAEWFSFGTFSRYLYVPLDAVNKNIPAEVVHNAEIFNDCILFAAAAILLILTTCVLEFYVEWDKRKA